MTNINDLLDEFENQCVAFGTGIPNDYEEARVAIDDEVKRMQDENARLWDDVMAYRNKQYDHKWISEAEHLSEIFPLTEDQFKSRAMQLELQGSLAHMARIARIMQDRIAELERENNELMSTLRKYDTVLIKRALAIEKSSTQPDKPGIGIWLNGTEQMEGR
jgi:hypothetical protein